VAPDRRQDRRDLRHPRAPPDAGQARTIIDRIEHGHHVFRAYFKNAFLKRYEKFSTFLRNELVSNNLADFRLKKGLDHLQAVRERFQTITARFAGFQAQWLNVHVDFPLLQRLAFPITIGAVRYSGIKIHEPRVIRLLEVLLHSGNHLGGWPAKQIHHAILITFHLSETTYRLNSSATICASSRATPSYSARARATPLGSRQKASKSRCSFCSFTNASAAPSPTAAFITVPTLVTNPPAGSKSPITAPTEPFKPSSTCSVPDLLPDSSTLLVYDFSS
jgi:hypothetical protein